MDKCRNLHMETQRWCRRFGRLLKHLEQEGFTCKLGKRSKDWVCVKGTARYKFPSYEKALGMVGVIDTWKVRPIKSGPILSQAWRFTGVACLDKRFA